jgi:terminase large subunit-like protein
MAATLRQRQKAAEVLRGGGTHPRAAKAAGVNVSTIKRWLKEPAFRAMVTTSPDIRAGAPGRMNGRGGSREPQRDERSRMWVAASGDRFEVLGYQIPPSAYDAAASVLHVHVVRPEACDRVAASIDDGAFPTDSAYVSVPLKELDDVLDNLPFVCRLGSGDELESLMAWLEVWTVIDEGGFSRTLADSLWEGQRRFLESLLKHRHVLSIKARKVGLSTLVCAHAAWTARIRDPNASVNLFSYREDAARELLSNLRTGFNGLPAFLRLPLIRETSNVLVYAAGPSDTRALKVYPATSKAAIEATSSHIVLDEWAHMGDAEAVWTAVEPTLSARATSALITTARTSGDFVHDYYTRSEAGETRHKPVFVSVLERADRSIAWLEEKRRQEGKWRVLRNYPLTAEEAFAAPGEPYFPAELLDAAQHDAMRPSPVRRGDRYLKAWDIGRRDASVCVVLRVPSADEAEIYNVMDYHRLAGEDYPTIQREIKAMHRRYPGPTVVESNSIGLPLIENLGLPEAELIAHHTTQASKEQMLTAIELLLQQRALKIHAGFRQLLTELASYRRPDNSITQDSVMALGIAVQNAELAHARGASESVLDLEPFSDEWYAWYEARRTRSEIDLLNDNDARRGIIPTNERRARERAKRRLPPS